MTEPATPAVPARLEDLKPGVRVAGLLPEPVTVLAVASHGPDAIAVTFQGVNGDLGQRLLYRADEARLVVQPPGLFVPNDGYQGGWLTWAGDG
jgi:hypothetical protein